ncbi:CGNR zinc finger domain-containing protein [Paenibacillus puldeungensis]|uniref:CGNR zinc finger domain-containing protein n=1 Tax=Paenibacillus puldeungensis TaxID=696536 RepID=A0ABW3RSN8_9BACL
MNDTNKFPLISGNPSLDLVNTELVRRGQRHDLLTSLDDVMDWLNVEAECLGIDDMLLGEVGPRERQLISCILELRAMLRKQFEQIADGHPISNHFIAYLETKIERAPFTYKLKNQTLLPVPVGKVEDAIGSLIAYDALTLIQSQKLDYLKHCSNPDCVLLFIDESGRRKWCSMQICGNRKKAARFQHRKASEE